MIDHEVEKRKFYDFYENNDLGFPIAKREIYKMKEFGIIKIEKKARKF